MNSSPFPEIKSERLLLRQINTSDGEAILYLRSDETINQFIERPEHRKTKTLDQAIAFIEKINIDFQNKESVSWGICFINNTQLIGTITLWNFSANNTIAEVCYGLSPEFQNKGIMSEALKAVIDYGFRDLKLVKIEAFTHHNNEHSKKLLEKTDFHFMENRKDQDNPSNSIFELDKPTI